MIDTPFPPSIYLFIYPRLFVSRRTVNPSPYSFLSTLYFVFILNLIFSAIGSISVQRQPNISIRTKEIRLVRDGVGSGGSSGDGGYGITLRSNNNNNSAGCDSNNGIKNGRSFMITFVKPNSPADRYLHIVL